MTLCASTTMKPAKVATSDELQDVSAWRLTLRTMLSLSSIVKRVGLSAEASTSIALA